MYSGFFVHSPSAAHLSQLSFSSVQFPWLVIILSKEATWIHFVADHFSPSITGHPAWRLPWSVVASGWRLKNRRAFPRFGLTKKNVNQMQRSQILQNKMRRQSTVTSVSVSWTLTCFSSLGTFWKAIILGIFTTVPRFLHKAKEKITKSDTPDEE